MNAGIQGIINEKYKNGKIIKDKIYNFEELKKDQHHSYYSWEHCYSFFRTNYEELKRIPSNKEMMDLACLHLGFYLASWGMLRGSSALLGKTYTVYGDTIAVLLKNEYEICWNPDGQIKNNNSNELIEKIKALKAELKKPLKVVGTFNASDTLISKILLGVTGCIPAYDDFFKTGLEMVFRNPLPHGIKTLNDTSLRLLIDFYKEYQRDIDEIKIQTNNTKRYPYPIMKKIDMFFWEVGKE